MGGVAGVIDLTGTREVEPRKLGSMLRTVAHRGPAGETTRQQAGVAVGVC